MTGLDGIGAAELFDRARALLLARDTAAADRLIRHGRSRTPDDSALAYLHGLCHTMAGAPAEAAEAFEAALELDPDNGRYGASAQPGAAPVRSAGRRSARDERIWSGGMPETPVC